jgi:fatty acid desaturase
MLQFFLSAATVSVIQLFFYSERIFKKLMTIWRATFMLLGILLTHIIYIVGFGWFSFRQFYAWLAFIMCLITGFFFGLLFIVIKTKIENRQYDRLLAKYKEQHEGENEHE